MMQALASFCNQLVIISHQVDATRQIVTSMITMRLAGVADVAAALMLTRCRTLLTFTNRELKLYRLACCR